MSTKNVSVPHDPDAKYKQHLRFYALSQLRKGTGTSLHAPITQDESLTLSIQMYSETQRAALHKQHNLYLKLMRMTGQLPPEKNYTLPLILLTTLPKPDPGNKGEVSETKADDA